MNKKIAIISDTHGNLPAVENLKKILKKEGIDFIIHCGDIGGPDFLKNLFKSFKVRAVLGNMDAGFGTLKDYQNPPDILVEQEIGYADIGSKKTAFTHFPGTAKELAKTGKYDFVFYGHTHKPWEEKIGACRVLNPGNVSGTFFSPSFAIYDLEKDSFELRRL